MAVVTHGAALSSTASGARTDWTSCCGQRDEGLRGRGPPGSRDAGAGQPGPEPVVSGARSSGGDPVPAADRARPRPVDPPRPAADRGGGRLDEAAPVVAPAGGRSPLRLSPRTRRPARNADARLSLAERRD